MPVDSAYTDKIVRFMRTHKKPVTATEIQEAVNLSRAGAYWWIKNSGADLIQEVGVGRNGASAYVLREDAKQYPTNFRPHGTWTVVGSGGAGGGNKAQRKPDFRLGSVFTVVGMRIEQGDDGRQVEVVDLRGENGAVLSVSVPS